MKARQTAGRVSTMARLRAGPAPRPVDQSAGCVRRSRRGRDTRRRRWAVGASGAGAVYDDEVPTVLGVQSV